MNHFVMVSNEFIEDGLWHSIKQNHRHLFVSNKRTRLDNNMWKCELIFTHKVLQALPAGDIGIYLRVRTTDRKTLIDYIEHIPTGEKIKINHSDT